MHVQVVLEELRAVSGTIAALPVAPLALIASSEYRPMLLGCCNMNCTNHEAGRMEKEVHLFGCLRCGLVSVICF